MRKIILASTSPRRISLIKSVTPKALVVSSNYREVHHKHLKPVDLVKFLAKGKANAVANKYKDAIVVGADTVVVFQGKVLGKPKNKSDARKMLKMLSGKINYIVTGLVVIDLAADKIFKHAGTVKVYFKKLLDEDIDQYIESGEPMDKAGAYAVWNKKIIEKFEGDNDAAAGLPVKALKAILKTLNATTIKRGRAL